MFYGRFKLRFAASLLLAAQLHPVGALAQKDLNRKVKTKVAPAYPEVAKRMNLSGVVKLLVTVDTKGSVKDASVLGGHPVLAGAALEAVVKWRFDPAPEESSGVVAIRFEPRPQ